MSSTEQQPNSINKAEVSATEQALDNATTQQRETENDGVAQPPVKKCKVPEEGNSKTLVMLGSSSKFRAALVAKAIPEGCELTKERLSPDIDEKAIRRDDPSEMVIAISIAKTDKLKEVLAQKRTENNSDQLQQPDVLICCDQVICFNDQVREKPVDAAQAKSHLQSYGKENIPARCISGVVVTNLASGKQRTGVDIAVQHFKPIPDDVAEALIAKGDVLYCAGSFVVEDELLAPYLGERTGEIECVQGMPIAMTRRLIEEVLG